MKALLIGILYAAMRKYIGGGVFDRIKEAVETINDRSIPGSQKREIVLDALAWRPAKSARTPCLLHLKSSC